MVGLRSPWTGGAARALRGALLRRPGLLRGRGLLRPAGPAGPAVAGRRAAAALRRRLQPCWAGAAGPRLVRGAACQPCAACCCGAIAGCALKASAAGAAARGSAADRRWRCPDARSSRGRSPSGGSAGPATYVPLVLPWSSMTQLRPPQLTVACRQETLASSSTMSPCGSRPTLYDRDGSSVQVLSVQFQYEFRHSMPHYIVPRVTPCHGESRDGEHREELFQARPPDRKPGRDRVQGLAPVPSNSPGAREEPMDGQGSPDSGCSGRTGCRGERRRPPGTTCTSAPEAASGGSG